MLGPDEGLGAGGGERCRVKDGTEVGDPARGAQSLGKACRLCGRAKMTLTGTGTEEQWPRFRAASGFSCSSTHPGVDPPAAPPPAALQGVPSSLSCHPITVCSRDARLKAAQSQHLSADANPPLNGTIPPICSQRETPCVPSVPPGPSQAYNHVHPPPGQSHHLTQCTMSRTRAEHPGASERGGPWPKLEKVHRTKPAAPGGGGES